MEKYYQSRIPYIFGSTISGIIIGGWLLGQIGVTGFGESALVVSLGVLLFLVPIFFLLALLSFYPPNCISFNSQTILLGSVNLIQRRIEIPIKSIEEVKTIRKRIDNDGDSLVLRFVLKKDHKIDDLKSGFSSTNDFGFIYGNCFDCIISMPDKVKLDIVDSINEKIKLANNKMQSKQKSLRG